VSIDEVTIRDLRNHGGSVVDRVERGETVIVTRDGVQVAELRPLPRPRLNAAALLARWRTVPLVDAAEMRADIDSVLDPEL
jgi:prevent-host-death family protein